MGFIVVCIVIFIVCMGIVKGIDSSQERTAEKSNEKFLNEIQNVCNRDGIEYQEPTSIKITLPDNCGYKYDYSNEVVFECSDMSIIPALYWANKKQLFFVGRNSSFEVDMDKIEMYTSDGTIQYISKVDNTGKNISVPGAIVGGLIAGTAGMIIGATKDRNNISTNVEKKDERKIYVYYKDKNDNIKMFNVQKSFFCDDFNFDKFIRKELPNKSDTSLIAHQNERKETNDESVEENFKKIKKLYEDGLIDKEDYEIKKKELLKRI